jgi:transcriptional regulator GlxA family with amidase domain
VTAADRSDRSTRSAPPPGPLAPPGRRLTIVAYPRVQILDVTGPHEVFSLANRFVVDPPVASGLRAAPGAAAPYAIEVVARATDAPGAVRSSSGLLLGVDRCLAGAAPGPADDDIDTLMVAGGEGTVEAATDPLLLDWLRAVAPGCRRVTSVCSGAFVLAAAGLLDGRRATTHWSECATLERLFPAVAVEPDPIFVRDGDVVTSAGITAGMDLALALVEQDLGRDLALAVSRWLVMFVQRPGGQSQFSSQLAAQLADRRPLRELQGWLSDHLADDLSVAALAGRVAMSPRHFARVFRAEIGVTPAQYVEQLRVELARRLLETTDRPVDQIAREAGFGTAETLQRSFRRRVRTTPGEYRRLFTRSPGGNRVQPV